MYIYIYIYHGSEVYMQNINLQGGSFKKKITQGPSCNIIFISTEPGFGAYKLYIHVALVGML